MQIARLSRPGDLLYILNCSVTSTLVAAFLPHRQRPCYLASRLSNRRIIPIEIVSWFLIPGEKLESW